MSAFEDRFVKRAQASPDFDAALRQRFGFDGAGVTALLGLASKLATPAGAQLSDRDVQTLQRLHPHLDGNVVAAAVATINRAPAASRHDLFIGALASDSAAMQGDYVNAGDAFREVQQLSTAYQTQQYADTLIARRGGADAEAPRYKPEEGSIRALVEAQFTHPNQRAFAQALEAGDPNAEGIARDALAQSIEGAAARLEQPDISTREALDAAYSLHVGEAHASEQFGIGDTQ